MQFLHVAKRPLTHFVHVGDSKLQFFEGRRAALHPFHACWMFKTVVKRKFPSSRATCTCSKLGLDAIV